MHEPYPGELRTRVIDFVQEGGSRREAAEQFDVSVSSAIRWVQRFRENGAFEPNPRGGSTSPLEKYSRQILALISEESGLWSGERSIRAITPDPPTERTKTIIPGNANNAVRVFGH